LPASGALGDLWIIDQTGSGATAGDGYVWTAGNVWLNIGPIRGPEGIQGAAGTDGTDGADGTDGNDGAAGAAGAAGTDGVDGVQGTQGIQGAQGTQGTPGVNPTGAVLNTSDTFTTPIVKFIVSLTQTEYNNLTIDANTLYVII
jgi:hypothetical protein